MKTINTIRDFSNAYRDTTVHYNEQGRVYPFKIWGVQGAGSVEDSEELDEEEIAEIKYHVGWDDVYTADLPWDLKISGQVFMKGHWKSKVVPLKSLTLTYPTLGWVNYRRVAAYVTRVPARQWKAGFTWGTARVLTEPYQLESRYESVISSLYDLTPSESMAAFMGSMNIEDIFNRKWYTPGVLEAAVRERNLLIGAWSPKYAVGMTLSSPHPVVFYKIWKIGELIDGTVWMFDRACSHLEEELAQAFNVEYKV